MDHLSRDISTVSSGVIFANRGVFSRMIAAITLMSFKAPLCLSELQCHIRAKQFFLEQKSEIVLYFITKFALQCKQWFLFLLAFLSGQKRFPHQIIICGWQVFPFDRRIVNINRAISPKSEKLPPIFSCRLNLCRKRQSRLFTALCWWSLLLVWELIVVNFVEKGSKIVETKYCLIRGWKQ